jgi:hypothetical protein
MKQAEIDKTDSLQDGISIGHFREVCLALLRLFYV